MLGGEGRFDAPGLCRRVDALLKPVYHLHVRACE